MKFRVKTYLIGQQKDDKTRRFLEYIFNLMYRSISPLMLFWMLLEWTKPMLANLAIVLVLLFFVFYQFTWEIRE